jgi:uncharacterized zinc-type alcohol dehydrogenase-like protein
MIQTRGYAVRDAYSPLTPFSFARRDPGAHDVQIEILRHLPFGFTSGPQ